MSAKQITWHDYKFLGRATRKEFEDYLHSLPDTDYKAHNLQRLAAEHPPKRSTDETTTSELPSLEASRPDGTNGYPNRNPNHNPKHFVL